MEEIEILSRMLKVSAMQNGLCDQWTTEWDNDCSRDGLIMKYKKGLDFCIKNDWPSKDFVNSNFDKSFLASRHIYSDVEAFDDGDFSDIATIVQHGSTGELHFVGYNTTTLWVLHDSEVFVSAAQHANIFVHVYGDAYVTISCQGDAKVTVKRHSKSATIIRSGNVKCIDPFI